MSPSQQSFSNQSDEQGKPSLTTTLDINTLESHLWEAANILQRLWNYCNVLRDDAVSNGEARDITGVCRLNSFNAEDIAMDTEDIIEDQFLWRFDAYQNMRNAGDIIHIDGAIEYKELKSDNPELDYSDHDYGVPIWVDRD